MSNKLPLQTPNLTAQNIDKIAALFPNCITEMPDEEKSTPDHKVYKRGINFELLKQMLSPDVVDGDEAYEFTWVGKKASIVEANKPIRKTLRPCPEESKNWDDTENLYIEGDNLEVLKLLQESYLGKVKMIYIDPPYNTGNDFIYADDFMRSQDEENRQMGMYDEDENRLFKNNDSNGRFHSDWCSMMYSRLMLARNLLTDDGAIFISINDYESDTLRKLCDEIFGHENFVAQVVWQKSKKGDAKLISICHEYALIYVKSQRYLLSNGIKWRKPKQGLEDIFNQYEKLRSLYGSNHQEIQKQMKLWYASLPPDHPARASKHYCYSDDRGLYFADNFAGPDDGRTNRPRYDIIHPITGKPCKKPSTGWRWDEKRTKAALEANPPLIHFGPTEETIPCRKSYLKDVSTEPFSSVFYKDGRSATLKVEQLLGKGVFDFPKDVDILSQFIKLVTDEDSIIIDFFSGSASTAHAVMQLNAEDNGHRKFIMVQLPEPCDEKSEAYKAGYKTICDIGKERIRRAGEKIKQEDDCWKYVPLNRMDGSKPGDDTTAKIVKTIDAGDGKPPIEMVDISKNPDVGFRVFKLDDTNMKDVYYSAEEYSQTNLEELESNIKEDRTDLDLLFGCLLDWGLPLSMPYRSEKIGNCTVHTYAPGDAALNVPDALIACFDSNVPENVIKEIAKRKPRRAVFRDSSFASSPEKINVFEIFKLYAPDTDVKVI